MEERAHRNVTLVEIFNISYLQFSRGIFLDPLILELIGDWCCCYCCCYLGDYYATMHDADSFTQLRSYSVLAVIICQILLMIIADSTISHLT